MIRDTKRFAFELDTLTLLRDTKALAALAEKYKPQEGLNFIAFTFHATAPEVNMKGMAVTPATMMASMESAIHTMVDFEHRVDDIDLPSNHDFDNEIMGHIVELSMGDIPAVDDAEAWAFAPYIPQEPIVTTGVMALYTRVFQIARIADEVSRGASWFFSLEIGLNCTEPAIWLAGNDEKPHEIIPWVDATQELREIASQPKLMEYEDRPVAYLMGGADGKIPFIGGAITRNPAGFEQRQPGNSLKLIASAGGNIYDSVSDKIWKAEGWKKNIQASLKNRKEASSSDGDEVGFSPVLINDLKELIEVTDVVTELIENDDDTGGEDKVAKIEIEEKDLAKRIADARAEGVTEGDTAGHKRGMTEGAVAGVEKAVEEGTHIQADQVDGIVEKRLMSTGRKTKINSLPCDDDTKADFLDIASNEDRYPLDVDGETKFDESFARWETSMKTASNDDGDDKDKKKDGKDDKGDDSKKSASDEDAKKKDLDLGGGGGGGDESFDDLLEMKEEEV